METLIINKRHELPFRKKILWDMVTIALWVGWIYLWKPLLVVIYNIVMLDAEPDQIWNVILNDISVIPVEHALEMLIMTPLLLLALSRINRHRAPTEHLLYRQDDYADYFKIDHEQLKECTQSQMVTVYHDENGHIVRLEKRIDAGVKHRRNVAVENA